MKLLLISFSLLFIFCTDKPETSISYNDIQGYYVNPGSALVWNHNTGETRPTEWLVFKNQESWMYTESWQYDGSTGLNDYLITKEHYSDYFYTCEAGEYSYDNGYEVMTVQWCQMITNSSGKKQNLGDNGIVQSFVLLDLIDNSTTDNGIGDTLLVGLCGSIDCGGDQILKAGHSDEFSFVRISKEEFDAKYNKWSFY